MAQHPETNPHFIIQQPRQDDGHHQTRPWPHHQRRPRSEDDDPRAHSRVPQVQWMPEPEPEHPHPHRQHEVPLMVPHSPEDRHTRWAPRTQRTSQGTQPPNPRTSQGTQPYDPRQGTQPYDPQPPQPKQKARRGPAPLLVPEHHGSHSRPHAGPLLVPEHHGSHSRPHGTPPEEQPQPKAQRHSRPREEQPPQRQGRRFQPLGEHPQGRRSNPHSGQHHGQGLWTPASRKTKPLTWFAAVFCVIFWIIIILGGIIVLIVYLVFRPRSPRFEVSSATLNAAYLDMGYLLNADITLLTNFTNPNKKVGVDFSSMIVDLYYGSTLIATQAIEPFSAERLHSKFETVHLVSSQVRLPIKESQRLQKQMAGNGAIFEVKGMFRTRSRLGSVLRYSYWLYGHCKIVLTAPPTGVLRASYCRTKR